MAVFEQNIVKIIWHTDDDNIDNSDDDEAKTKVKQHFDYFFSSGENI